MRSSTQRLACAAGRSGRWASIKACAQSRVLKETRNHHRFVGEDPVGGDLETDQGNGEACRRRLPTTPLASHPGDLDQLVAAGRIDAIGREHVPNVARGRADLAGLDAGDLRAGAFQDAGDLVDGLAGLLAQLAQLDSEAASLNRRTWSGRHESSPSASCRLAQATIVVLGSGCICRSGSQTALAYDLPNRHSYLRERIISPTGKETRHESKRSSPVLPPYGTCVARGGADRAKGRTDGCHLVAPRRGVSDPGRSGRCARRRHPDPLRSPLDPSTREAAHERVGGAAPVPGVEASQDERGDA